MMTRSRNRSGSPRIAGFTLVELLVVTAIIALLISILLPSLNKARRTAREMVCAADIRSLIQVSITYASDSSGYFPDLNRDRDNPTATNGHVYWTFVSWRKHLEKAYGVRRSMWYSVSNPNWAGDHFYYYGWDGSDPETATHLVHGRFYFGSATVNSRDSFTSTYQFMPAGGIQRPLFASRVSDNPYLTLMWTDLNRQYPNNPADNFITAPHYWGSNHLYDVNKNWPEGTHNGHVDGHVEWVNGAHVKFQMLSGASELYW